MSSASMLASAVLADESKKSGPIGLAVILVLCVICYFLFKSMSRHLRKVREDFGPDQSLGAPVVPPAPPAPLDAATDPTAAEAPNTNPQP